MDELKMTGNCLKGSRPILSFDSVFDSDPHWKLYKEMFVQIFGSPKGHPKTKPFIDHIFSFTVADGRIWFRNYQIVYDADPTASAKEAKNSDPVLVEIGPRMVLWPVKILSGSFSGESLYENPEYKTPPIVRKLSSSKPASDYTSQLVSKKKRKLAILNIEKPDTELDIIFNDD
jgi:ribosome biogenesis protein BRX1